MINRIRQQIRVKINCNFTSFFRLFVLLGLIHGTIGCSQKKADGKASEKMIICSGSETMKKLSESWSKAYKIQKQNISVEVYGGGSGIGLSSLIHGDVDMANSSRKITPEEIQYAKEHFDKEPQDIVVAYDAVVIYVHKSNPIDELSLGELAEIFGKEGEITKWAQIDTAGFRDEEIMVINRQPNSGTYQTFKNVVLGTKAAFRTITYEKQTAQEVVEMVSRDSLAIGYSGIAFANEGVKILKISRTRDDEALDPIVELSKSGLSMYPISRPLYIYTLGKPEKHIQKYINWILSKSGQRLVKEQGYVPIGQLD